MPRINNGINKLELKNKDRGCKKHVQKTLLFGLFLPTKSPVRMDENLYKKNIH